MSFTGNHSKETKAQIAAAHRGRKRSAEHTRRIAEGMKRRNANGGVSPHGTAARYKGRPPCRCDECREGWRLYKGARRKVKRS
jgi:hypothetical protein